MSTVSTSAVAGPDGLSTSEPERSHLACFTACDLHPATVLVAAEGEIDACNAGDLVDYAERQSVLYPKLILDLSRVDFFGTQGFSALHKVNVSCSRRGVAWVAVPSREVMRLLRVCDPGGGLPLAVTVEAAMAMLKQRPRRDLELIPHAD
jgi:anti-anti-sigma factor